MRTARSRQHPARYWLAACLLPALVLLAAGCATTSTPPTAAPGEIAVPRLPEPEVVPVVRYGRYTLVELVPTAVQQDLLLQPVDVDIPDTLQASVGDALRHVLLRSGYRLCRGPATDALDALPLPGAHHHLGPLLLRDALLTLAGPAWDLQVDDAARRICLSDSRKTQRERSAPGPVPIPEIEVGAETFPLEDRP